MNLLIFNALSWEQRKLAELVTRYEDPVETPHDGYIRLGIRSHAKGTFHEYVEPGHELETAQMHRVAANKLIFNITFAWEHAVAITTEDDAGKLVSHRFPQFSLSELLRPEFLKYVILDEGFHHKLYLASPGGAGRNRVLKVDEALDYSIFFPSVEEQHKLGEFLNQLNDLITLHQSKAESWKNKKNQLSTISWEQRKLGDIADVTKLAGFEFTEHVVYSDKGNIIALRGLNIKNGQLVLDDVKYIDGSNFAKLNRSKLFIDDIMFTYVGTVGEVAIIKENDRFYLAPNVSRIRVQSNDSSKFISHYMRTDSFYRHVIFPLIATSSQPALSMENIRKFEICLPKNRDEQDKLSEFFDGIDNLITLHHRKLNRTQICINRSFLYGSF